MSIDIFQVEQLLQKPKPKEPVIKVKTSSYLTKRGMAVKRELHFMKRLSGEFNPFTEDGAAIMDMIENLHEVNDGLYTMLYIYHSTGYHDCGDGDWTIKLIKFGEDKNEQRSE